MQRFNTKKKAFDDVTGIIMEHSPEKFKTTYKDDMRQFSGSPAKEALEGDALDGDIEPGEQVFDTAPAIDDSRQILSGIGGGNADLRAISSADNAAARSQSGIARQSGKGGSSKHPSTYGEQIYPKRGGVHFDATAETPEAPQGWQNYLTAEERAQQMAELKEKATTRFRLADSAFTTYYGKPPFHAYGKGNTNPANFSQKMMTHNINAASGTYTDGKNGAPAAERAGAGYAQVYDAALLAGLERNKGVRVPTLPRKAKGRPKKKNKDGNEDEEQEPGKATEAILPKPYEDQRREVAKKKNLGGWGGKKVSIVIAKPRYTIGGYELDKDEVEALKKGQAAAAEDVGKASTYSKQSGGRSLSRLSGKKSRASSSKRSGAHLAA